MCAKRSCCIKLFLSLLEEELKFYKKKKRDMTISKSSLVFRKIVNILKERIIITHFIRDIINNNYTSASIINFVASCIIFFYLFDSLILQLF